MPIPFFYFITLGLAIGVCWGIAGMMLYNIVVKRSWPIRIPIAIQRAKSVVWDLDERAKLKKSKDGYEVIRLRKRKHNIKPPKFQRVTVNKKGKPVYPIYNTTSGQYFPIRLMNPPRLEVIEDKSSKNWAITEHDRLISVYRPKESAFMRLLPYIMNATFAAMVIFFVIYFGGKMEIVSGKLAGAAQALTNAMTSFKG